MIELKATISKAWFGGVAGFGWAGGPLHILKSRPACGSARCGCKQHFGLMHVPQEKASEHQGTRLQKKKPRVELVLCVLRRCIWSTPQRLASERSQRSPCGSTTWSVTFSRETSLDRDSEASPDDGFRGRMAFSRATVGRPQSLHLLGTRPCAAPQPPRCRGVAIVPVARCVVLKRAGRLHPNRALRYQELPLTGAQSSRNWWCL